MCRLAMPRESTSRQSLCADIDGFPAVVGRILEHLGLWAPLPIARSRLAEKLERFARHIALVNDRNGCTL